MSKYTTEVRFICEEYAGLSESQGYTSVNQIIQQAIPLIFEHFPIYDESYRNVLETKILRHFYTREIGLETVGLWKLHLNTRLIEIMPYYNQLYKSAMLDYNPLYDTDLTRDHVLKRDSDRTIAEKEHNTNQNQIQGTSSAETESTDSATGESNSTQNTNISDSQLQKMADTPQVDMTGPIFTNYLTSAQEQTGTNTNKQTGSANTTSQAKANSNSSGKTTTDQSSIADNSRNVNDGLQSTDDYLEHVKGKSPGSSFSKYILEYRETIINIDMMIINELNDLFMNLW